MQTSLTFIALAAYLCTLLRLLAYRRQGARYRKCMSWLAWIFMATLGGTAIDLALHNRPIDLFDAAMAVFIAGFAWAVRGNVARLLDQQAQTR
ncbi:phage holin family protein [Mycetohabitans rhizoxinica]|jgi:formate-dependent nitrite reductase membrane component NrfD|uniref:Phage holin family protein n=1 Tax=Mycetohabitans rhizoxinica TaxID=412963 RepID=A0ABZ2PXF9_9BURK|nr:MULTISPECIES: phage holin family protein [Burkholderiaceae]MCG1017377.1 phage holin family protein [Mycetohabitans sp. B4]SIT70484.1 Putative 3TM holin, Phage_holin_3 [Burkholderia sp. b13]